MKTEKDIFSELMSKLNTRQFSDVGYDNIRGNRMICLHDVKFRASRGYIVPNHEDYPDMGDMKWYEENYLPIVQRQYNKVVEKLQKNEQSRQAIIFFGSEKEHETDEMICTMYVNLYIKYGVLYYNVHMRSNDVIEYQTDVKFHEDIAIQLAHDLDCIESEIIWYVDNMHMYINEGTISAIEKMYDENINAMKSCLVSK